MLTFTPDGSRILVANEAEPVSTANNPDGTISIIDLSGGAASATVATTIGFTALNGSEARSTTRSGLALFPGQTRGGRHRAGIHRGVARTARAPMSRCRRSTPSR